jgi:hypothetical protein
MAFSKPRETRSFNTQVNEPTKNNKVEHVAEGIESALAVAVITRNKDNEIIT